MKKKLLSILLTTFTLFLTGIKAEAANLNFDKDAIIIDEANGHREYKITKKEAKQLEKNMKENQLAKIKEEKAEYKRLKEEIKRLKKENKGKIEAQEPVLEDKKLEKIKAKKQKLEKTAKESELEPVSDTKQEKVKKVKKAKEEKISDIKEKPKKIKKQKEQATEESNLEAVSNTKEKKTNEEFLKNKEQILNLKEKRNSKEEKIEKPKKAKKDAEYDGIPILEDKKTTKEISEEKIKEDIVPVSDNKEKRQAKIKEETKEEPLEEKEEKTLTSKEKKASKEEAELKTNKETEDIIPVAAEEERAPEIYKKNHTYEDIDKGAVSINEFLQFTNQQNEKFSLFYYKTTSKLNSYTKQIKDKEKYIKEVKKGDLGYKAQYDKLKKADRELETLMRERDDFYNKSLEKFNTILNKKQAIKWELLQQMGYRFLPEFD